MECAGNIQQMCVQQYTKIHKRFDWTYKYIICNFNKGMDNVGTSYTADVCLKVRAQASTAVQVGWGQHSLECATLLQRMSDIDIRTQLLQYGQTSCDTISAADIVALHA
jgi:hypothetical protein